MKEIYEEFRTYSITKNGKEIEVILKGRAGDNFGHVQDIETGVIFGTYGYNFLQPKGMVSRKYTFKREVN